MQWLFTFASKTGFFSRIDATIISWFLIIACRIGFDEVVKILMKHCPHVHPPDLLACATHSHANALKIMSESDLRLPAPLDVSICLELHSEITRFESAANIFAVIIMQHCEINELVELFCIGTGPISMTGSKYGIFPAALYPLFSDGRLREKADRLLAATDRRRICLFSSCRYGHPRADEMAICISCDHGHLMCAQCVSVGLSEPSHACEIHNDPTNAVMIDHIYGCSRLVTLARLGCRTAIETTLDDDEMFDALDDASREVVLFCVSRDASRL